MFNDEKYQHLSRSPACGQALWHYLLFGPRVGIVPGLLNIGLLGIADDLKWSPAATRRAWDEVEREGMAVADWSSSLIWLPKAVEHNPPENPNVVQSWGRALHEQIPECDLRRRAEDAIAAYLKTAFSMVYVRAFAKHLGEHFLERFAEAFPKGFQEGFIQDLPQGVSKGSDNQITDNSSTDPDRSKDQNDQDAAQPAAPRVADAPELDLRPPPRPKASATTPNEAHAFVARYVAQWQAHRRQTYGQPSGQAYAAVKRLQKTVTADRLWIGAEAFIETPATTWPYNGARTLEEFTTPRVWLHIEGQLIAAGILAPVAPTEAARG